ncbi:SagB family peptide dehydrogenase [Bacillus sp. FSL K6-4563]|uniref:SagB family peptide dehydrogenase n=1 Tax=Bacillus TaxID=1386 RepID=UPI00017A5FFB|nr:SagB family peptide dehydrogenase [Bacillus pumilus]EDW22003.1 NADH oxidase [Bacillus pumilus ATCC 7061]MCR4355021.1 SagB family peptide dehydrogenase [Bacillus pumilus]MCY7505765.1 SagB family peptide dehydrogenase [Bacillus pumilus]MDR4271870.1 SagB/ThcOx family dehydrogenase [Bacillus pumilus]MED4628767.1 SagB family peptide dehydrogenase [Bacillus pumilus]
MNLDDFLHNLHYENDKIMPQDWVVNWEDAPLPYKLYRGLPTFQLPSDIPLNLKQKKSSSKPTLQEIGHFLWYTFGLTQFSQTLHFTEQTEVPPTFRRFIPSGGALYPNELYIYLKIEDIPQGIYHYDVAHHRLVFLREGNFDTYLWRALGNRCDISSSFGTVFISTIFWKNFFKYHNFSYRLQGLDTGFVIGQLLEVGKRFGFETGVYYQFIDRAINHLLGISELNESVYAVIPLSIDPLMNWFNNNDVEEPSSATQLCTELISLEQRHCIRSQKNKEYPLLIKMNEACMIDSFPSLQQIEKETNEGSSSSLIFLPRVNKLSYDFSSACRNRYSPGMDFMLEQINQNKLSILFSEIVTTFSYRNDLDESFQKPPFRISLYSCFYNVEGITNGAFCYDSSIHALKTIQYGDFRSRLQYGLFTELVNMSQIPLSFNVVGRKDHYQSAYGCRGYRIQQMEAGILSQHLLLAASALNMGGHPLLGFDVTSYDDLYKMNEKGKTSLLQIPIGCFRPHPRLQGSLHN